jgi:hypothetical protein
MENYLNMYVSLVFIFQKYAISVKMFAFCVAMPCSLAAVSQIFRGTCCLRHQGKE